MLDATVCSARARRAIIIASADLVADHDQVRLIAAQVIARAGVSAREFYAAFGTLEACMLAAFDDGLARLTRTLAEAVPPGGSALARIEAGLIALLGFVDDEPGWGRLLLLELPLQARARRRGALRTLATLLSEIDFGEIDDVAPPPAQRQALTVLVEVLALIRSSLCAQPREPVAPLGPLLMARVVEPELRRMGCVSLQRIETTPQSPDTRASRLLRAVAENPNAGNRKLAAAALVGNESHASQLLRDLHRRGLIRNVKTTPGRANAWVLTQIGRACVAGRSPAGAAEE